MLPFDQVLSPEAVDRVINQMPRLEPTISLVEAFAALERIRDAERPMRKELEKLATSIVYNNFPIFLNNKPHIKVKAKLVDYILEEGGSSDKKKFKPELLLEYRKRKLINMMTQGAGISTHGIHHLSDDFKQQNEELIADYDAFDRHNRYLMRTVPEAHIMSKTEQSMESAMVLGRVKVEHVSGKWVIVAEAVLMPVLIHEIVKGMYELIAMSGLPEDDEIRRDVLEFTDTKLNELVDCKYGETIYPLIRDYIRGNFHEITDERPEAQEYYLQQLYKESPAIMIDTMEQMILGRMDPKSVRSVMNDIYRDLKKDDFLQ